MMTFCDACKVQGDWINMNMSDLAENLIKQIWVFSAPVPSQLIGISGGSVDVEPWLTCFLTSHSRGDDDNYAVADFEGPGIFFIVMRTLAGSPPALFKLGFDNVKTVDQLLILPEGTDRVLQVNDSFALISCKFGARVKMVMANFRECTLECIATFDLGESQRVTAAASFEAGLFIVVSEGDSATLYRCQSSGHGTILVAIFSFAFGVHAFHMYQRSRPVFALFNKDSMKYTMIDLTTHTRHVITTSGDVQECVCIAPDFVNDVIHVGLNSFFKPIYL